MRNEKVRAIGFMAQGRARNHHFLPQGLQKYFCDENEQIWYAEKASNGTFCRPEPRNTRSTFKLRDYYTVIENGKLSDKVETEFYGVLDDFLAKFLADIHQALDNALIPDVKGDALSSIRKVLYHLIIRTPQFAANYDDFDIGYEYLAGLIAEATSLNLQEQDIFELQHKLKDASTVRNTGRSIRVRSQAASSEKIEEELDGFEVRFAISKGRHSFILSSQIAYRVGNGGHNGISNPNMEIWLPISPKRALVLVRDKQKKIPILAEEPRDHMRKINEYAIRNSDQVGSHSLKLLNSLLGR